MCASFTSETGILGPGHRFATDAQLAAYAGVAPLEASSAGAVRHRLNRGGNRRLNAVPYRIVLTQAHYLPATRAYIDRRLSEGKAGRRSHLACCLLKTGLVSNSAELYHRMSDSRPR